MRWECGEQSIELSGPPKIMGVLNVTPDSFSDGGRFMEPDAAVQRAHQMIADGADIVDVGGESTRPGANAVPADEQIARILPVIRALRETRPTVPISVDTRLAHVAEAALQAGASIINDVSALEYDIAMGKLVAKTGAGLVLMHMRGRPEFRFADPTTHGPPVYDDVVAEIKTYLQNRLKAVLTLGIDASRLVIDPGFGFGKNPEQNLTILRRLDEFVELERPLMVGMSRKRFIGAALAEPIPEQRLYGSLACVAAATLAGAHIIRVHDVSESFQVVRTCAAIRGAH
ncbi:MAG: dihydropteroate synthase [Planctomycetes bacterium]|nr:dihydropteroate synthase [Planctomycetota bacterium]